MESSEVKVPSDDVTYLRGEGVFETIRVVEGRVMFLEDHYHRLKESAGRFALTVPEEEVLRGRIEALLIANQLSEARVRVTLGENCLITMFPLSLSEVGVSLVSGERFPINEKSALAGIKCTSYAENMLIFRGAGGSEVLRPNTEGALCEACMANVFFMKGGQLFTPDLKTGCLPGVMRKQVLARAEVEVGVWPFEVVYEADEIWLTNSISGLRYVDSMNGKMMAAPSELFHELRVAIP